LTGNMKKRMVGVIICAAILALPGNVVLAIEPHEDPETATSVFSGISLFRYYSDSLNFVLQKNPVEVETRLEKMPFVNVPENLKESTNNFALTAVDMSYLVATIDENINSLRVLMQQFRLEELDELIPVISDNLSRANTQLRSVEQTIETIGNVLKVSSAPAGSDLRLAYNELLEKIDLIRETLVLYQELLEPPDITSEELLEPTAITAVVTPDIAFVGDNAQIKGILSSRGRPLAGREVDILLNGTRDVTVKTDIQGLYIATLQVPYLYIPEMDIQALYYPRENDIGRYIASASSVVKLKVMFYEARLEITVEDKSYPGLETTVTGKFDYNGPTPTDERDLEIYLDDILIAEAKIRDEFTQEIKLDPAISTGKHVITISSAAVGRYAPVIASAMLNVIRVVPVLDLDVPGLALIPGSIGLRGRVYSELGPLSGTSIEMELGNSKVQLLSSDDGNFDTVIKAGPSWSVIGSQNMVIHITPQEPWHAPLTTSRTILQVNMLNLGIIFGVFLFFCIFLPGRLKGWSGVSTRKRIIPEIATTQPEPVPVYSGRVTAIPDAQENTKSAGELLNRVFYWYRFLVRFIQEKTKELIRPQQTLREFALENRHALGPAGRYFTEITIIGERLLYSRHIPTQEDVEKTEQLSHRILEESEPEGQETQPAPKTGVSGEEEIEDEDI